ncbi:MAG: efflux RND transporter permease subunit [Candidatus Acidiferrales bacterium]
MIGLPSISVPDEGIVLVYHAYHDCCPRVDRRDHVRGSKHELQCPFSVFFQGTVRSQKTAVEVVLTSGLTRLGPILMTALAMMTGMIPMAFGWGEGDESNARLGRAVIGGLFFAVGARLFFISVVFNVLHDWSRQEFEAPTQT